MTFLKALGLTAVLYFTIGISGYILFNLLFLIKPHYVSFANYLFQIVAVIFSYYIFWKYFIKEEFPLSDIKKPNYDENLFLPLLIIAVGFAIAEQPIFDLYAKYTLPDDVYRSLDFRQSSWNLIDFMSLILTIVLAPVFEELFFRKYLIDNLSKRYSVKNALMMSSLLFAIIHLPNFANILPTFALGLISAYIYLKSGKIIHSILLHAMSNLLVILYNNFGQVLDGNLRKMDFDLSYWLIFLLGILILFAGLQLFSRKLEEKPQEKL